MTAPARKPTAHRLAAAAALAVLAAPPAAFADRAAIDRARAELGELRYEDALATLDRSLRSGTSGPDEMVALYMLLGEVQASLGDREQAEDAFRRALVIDAGAELREGLSPKISQPFAAARKSLRDKKPILVTHRLLAREQPTVALLVQADPLGMIVGARLIYWEDGAERSVAASGKERIDFQLPAGVGSFMLAAIDQHGNRVAEIGSQKEPLALDGAAAGSGGARGAASDGPEDGGGGRPLYAHWAVWAGGAAVLAGVGTWAGLRARSDADRLDEIRANSEMYEFSEAQAVADRAKRRALIANISFGAAAACAIVSGVLLFRGGGDERPAERAALVPLIAPDAAGVAAAVRF